MADVFTQAKRSEVMARIRSRGNCGTELALAGLLRAHRIRGWRRQRLVRVAVEGSSLKVERKKRPGSPQRATLNRQLTVRPDFVFAKSRTVIFVDGCFWHGCPKHSSPKKWPRKFLHPRFPGFVLLCGHDGDDAPHYLEKQVRQALKQVET